MTEFGDKGDGITRRDFLDGVAITAAGLAAAAAAPHLSGAEALAASRGHGPAPAAAGLLPADRDRPQGPAATRSSATSCGSTGRRTSATSTRRKGGPGIHVRHVRDSDETYDCVIVGAGASGLAAAKYYRDRFGEDSRILLLDPLPDFGGHSARNEFHVGADDVPQERRHGQPRHGHELEPDDRRVSRTSRAPTASRRSTCSSTSASTRSTSRARERPGHPVELRAAPDGAVPGQGLGRRHADPEQDGRGELGEWLARRRGRRRRGRASSGSSEDAQDWIALKHGPKTDAEKKAILSRLTQKRYYMDYIGVPEQAIRQYQRNGHGLLGAGAQAVSAGDMWALGSPGLRRARRRRAWRRRSPASGARRRWACRRARRTRRRRRGRTATRRCCGCSSAG